MPYFKIQVVDMNVIVKNPIALTCVKHLLKHWWITSFELNNKFTQMVIWCFMKYLAPSKNYK